MVQLRVGRSGLKELPLVIDADGQFYFKGEGDRTIWLSPHDEIDSLPATLLPRRLTWRRHRPFRGGCRLAVEAVERRWAGLRSFAPDRVPVYGYDLGVPNFFWCAGRAGSVSRPRPRSRAGRSFIAWRNARRLIQRRTIPARFDSD
jgi:D-arginine dehydrogenase